jgi:hypothetical protein
MFSNTIIGNITYMEKAVHEGREFLAITIAVNDMYEGACRIKFNNSNGLLTAFNNGTLVVGHQLILTQYDVRINSIRTHYMKDELLHQLRYPEIALTRVRAIMGATPKPKAISNDDPVADQVPFQAAPTLETVPF